MSVNFNGYTPGTQTSANIAITLIGSNSGCDTTKNYYYSINDGEWVYFGTGDSATYNITTDVNYKIKFLVTDGWGRWGTQTENYQIQRATGPTIITTDLPTGVDAIIYLDPTDLSKECNANNSVSTTGTKSGCMKWYAYSTSISDDDTYTMILDHNTTATVSLRTSVALAQLASDTTGWIGEPRLMYVGELFMVTGISSSINASIKNYPWLYDYTYNCTSYGCNVADNSTYGYYLDPKSSDDDVMYYVAYTGKSSCMGSLEYTGSDYTDKYGVRPVITISKSDFQ